MDEARSLLLSDVRLAIAGGEFDGELDAIVRAVRLRREVMVSPGDKVRLTNLSPKRVNGARGTVLAKDVKRGGKIKLLVDVPSFVGTRFRTPTWVSPSNVRLVEDEA